MSDVPDVKEGDKVSWPWGGGAPGGTAAEVKEDTVTMETKRGNEVKKKGEEGNPAVKIDRSGHDVVKKASELDVEKEGPGHKDGGDRGKGAGADEKKDGEKGKEEESAPAAEEKSKGKAAAAKGKGKKSETPKPAAEKEKEKPAAPATNGGEKKKAGRPKGSGGGKADKSKDKPKRKAATESGEPRRSKRGKTE